MKKLIAFLGLNLSLLILNINCKPEHAHIFDIGFKPAVVINPSNERQFNDYDVTSVFKNDIVFIVSYHYEYVARLINVNSGSECNAFKRALEFNNQLVDSTFSMKFGHPFVYNGDTINGDQNILENDKIRNEIEIFENFEAFDNSGADKVFDFSSSFIKKSVFDTAEYQVSFYCRTTDNLEFAKITPVKFQITK
jgi:hypothetical protein